MPSETAAVPPQTLQRASSWSLRFCPTRPSACLRRVPTPLSPPFAPQTPPPASPSLRLGVAKRNLSARAAGCQMFGGRFSEAAADAGCPLVRVGNILGPGASGTILLSIRFGRGNSLPALSPIRTRRKPGGLCSIRGHEPSAARTARQRGPCAGRGPPLPQPCRCVARPTPPSVPG
eukprot:EG_transcript_14914